MKKRRTVGHWSDVFYEANIDKYNTTQFYQPQYIILWVEPGLGCDDGSANEAKQIRSEIEVARFEFDGC